jgi:histidyl-tRNA synthetase
MSSIAKHEIPQGARLYFGKTAQQKISFDYETSKILSSYGFEPIITPNFIYRYDDNKKAIKISNKANENMSLRDDSTMETTRIITKRLGRATKHKKWFYNQPVFSYPTTENYQIGAEAIDNEQIEDMIKICLETLKPIGQSMNLQLFDMNIVKKISTNENIDIDIFIHNNIDKIVNRAIPWLTQMLFATTKNDIKLLIDIVPLYIQKDIVNILALGDTINHNLLTISPLYCSDVVYYDGVAFEVVCGKQTLAKGGKYMVDDMPSCGFSLYTDNILKTFRSDK